jgi:hypothetical protein
METSDETDNQGSKEIEHRNSWDTDSPIHDLL